MRCQISVVAITVCLAGSGYASTINGDYQFTVLNGTNVGLGAESVVPVINDDGTVVAVQREPVLTVGSDDTIEVISPLGDVQRYSIEGAVDIRQVSVTESGLIAAVAFWPSDGTGSGRLVVLDTSDGSFETVASFNVTTSGVGEFLNIPDIQMSENGDVAATVQSRSSGRVNVVRFSPDAAGGYSTTVLDEGRLPSDPDGVRNITNAVSIDDQGRIAWSVSAGSTQQTLVNDGTNTELVFASNQRAILNNEGQLLTTDIVGTTSELGITDITDGDPTDISLFGITNRAGTFDLNDYGQVLQLTNTGILELDGEALLRVGDIFDGLEIANPTSGGGPRIVGGEALADTGQIVLEAQYFERNGSGAVTGGGNLLVRLDPVGSTLETAIMPSSENNGVFEVGFDLVNALGVETGSPIYIDPIFGTGLSYSITNGAPNFTSLVVPTQDLGGLSMFDVVFQSFTETLAFGETLDFTRFVTGGVSGFEIFGTSGVASEQDFVAGFTFADQGTVGLDIRNVTRESDKPDPGVIPLPAGAWLFLGAFGMLATLRHRLP